MLSACSPVPETESPVELLKDTDAGVRGRAAEALGEIKSDDPKVLLALTEALNDTDTSVRNMAAWALAEIKF